MEGWKQACREICAAKGEPPCFKLDGHENCEPCEDCKVVGVVIDELQAETEQLRETLARLADVAEEYADDEFIADACDEARNVLSPQRTEDHE